MPGFKRTRYLTCFYCGRRTSTPYDRCTRQFDCPSCDATNYLDENGDITDPPSSVTQATTPRAVQYAAPRAISPPSSPRSSIFCETCLQHQHLVTASLAQYLPDDPDSPEYAELERKYYRFRNGLERRYPQICPDCEPKVRQRIEQSAYTAKTDALRRMIDRAKKNRATKQRSPLDLFDLAGRWLRVAGLTLQILWHASMLWALLENTHLARDSVSWASPLVHRAFSLLVWLPAPSHIIRWSFVVSICGSWWNPRFVQTVRGFTKHLVGLPQWYLYQAMTIVIRGLAMAACWTLVDLQDARIPSQVTGQVTGHLLIMSFALLTYKLAGASVRTDTTPLFGSSSSTPLRVQPEVPKDVGGDDLNGLSEVLDEILQTPAMPQKPSPATRPAGHGALQTGILPVAPNGTDSSLQIRSLRLTENPNATPATNAVSVQYGEEMDWTPTQSKHRAFNVYRTHQQGSAFGQAPTEPKNGHFWYRVPPAPTTPAQRLFNPPNQPRLRKSPETKPEITFRGAGGRAPDAPSHASSSARPEPVTFAEPSFFPLPPQGDPRNSLTDLFTDTFTLSQDREGGGANNSWVGSLVGLVYPKKQSRGI